MSKKKVKCAVCGKTLWRWPSQIKGNVFCSYQCHGKYTIESHPEFKKNLVHKAGEEHPRWSGGKTKDRYGYIKIRLPNHPKADKLGYVYEHRYVMSLKIGRWPEKNEIVHHINGDKTDNRPENLKLITEAEHKSLHSKAIGRRLGKRKYHIKCVLCGKDFVGSIRAKYCCDCKTRTCPVCHKTFLAPGTNIKQKFCSNRCRLTAMKQFSKFISSPHSQHTKQNARSF